LALASGASFGEMRQLAASLGYGQGRPNIQERYMNVPQIDPMAYLMPQMPQQKNQQFQGLTTDPQSGFDLIRQLSNMNQKSGKGGFNSKWMSGNQYASMAGGMGGMNAMNGMRGMGGMGGMGGFGY
jgi:hypothetical protein